MLGIFISDSLVRRSGGRANICSQQAWASRSGDWGFEESFSRTIHFLKGGCHLLATSRWSPTSKRWESSEGHETVEKSGLLREDTARNKNKAGRQLNVSRETLYHLCHKRLTSLHFCLSEAATTDESRRDRGNLMGEIAREADDVHWPVDIPINKKLADEFVMLCADQTQLPSLHPNITCMYPTWRYPSLLPLILRRSGAYDDVCVDRVHFSILFQHNSVGFLFCSVHCRVIFLSLIPLSKMWAKIK